MDSSREQYQQYLMDFSEEAYVDKSSQPYSIENKFMKQVNKNKESTNHQQYLNRELSGYVKPDKNNLIKGKKDLLIDVKNPAYINEEDKINQKFFIDEPDVYSVTLENGDKITYSDGVYGVTINDQKLTKEMKILDNDQKLTKGMKILDNGDIIIFTIEGIETYYEKDKYKIISTNSIPKIAKVEKKEMSGELDEANVFLNTYINKDEYKYNAETQEFLIRKENETEFSLFNNDNNKKFDGSVIFYFPEKGIKEPYYYDILSITEFTRDDIEREKIKNSKQIQRSRMGRKTFNNTLINTLINTKKPEPLYQRVDFEKYKENPEKPIRNEAIPEVKENVVNKNGVNETGVNETGGKSQKRRRHKKGKNLTQKQKMKTTKRQKKQNKKKNQKTKHYRK